MSRLLSAAEFANIIHVANTAAAPSKPAELKLAAPRSILRDPAFPWANQASVQVFESGRVVVVRNASVPSGLAGVERFDSWRQFELAYADFKPAAIVPGSFQAMPPVVQPLRILAPELAEKVWIHRRRASKPHSPTFVHDGVAVIAHRDAEDGSVTLILLDGRKEVFDSWGSFAAAYGFYEVQP